MAPSRFMFIFNSWTFASWFENSSVIRISDDTLGGGQGFGDRMGYASVAVISGINWFRVRWFRPHLVTSIKQLESNMTFESHVEKPEVSQVAGRSRLPFWMQSSKSSRSQVPVSHCPSCCTFLLSNCSGCYLDCGRDDSPRWHPIGNMKK